ncbi:hypothetical protein UFOVP1323_2 [uncultured Caudovirales phage]|uniref:Uncharacterized protein n=1 Tax=uncultured Caudovirales phage TaxID=2100421 RepID=A0A6J5RUD5_9CAUD|nr:hypothetical protein UFOVP1323_2 [uncultured Caudovirales phage]
MNSVEHGVTGWRDAAVARRKRAPCVFVLTLRSLLLLYLYVIMANDTHIHTYTGRLSCCYYNAINAHRELRSLMHCQTHFPIDTIYKVCNIDIPDKIGGRVGLGGYI